jgi:hypothetical protein
MVADRERLADSEQLDQAGKPEKRSEQRSHDYFGYFGSHHHTVIPASAA